MPSRRFRNISDQAPDDIVTDLTHIIDVLRHLFTGAQSAQPQEPAMHVKGDRRRQQVERGRVARLLLILG